MAGEDFENNLVLAWLPPDSGQAEMAKDILNQEGIFVHIEGSHTSIIAPYMMDLKVWIPGKDLQRARSILTTYGFLSEGETSERSTALPPPAGSTEEPV